MSTNRLESFSDGVIAVAITLLVLDITVPNHPLHLAHDLGHQWPKYAAYATSFITIGIIWINHHVVIGRLARADHSILILNLVLLATIGVIPFGTSLFSRYLNEAHGSNLAAAIYAGVFLLMSVAFTALNGQILLRRPHLLQTPSDMEQRRKIQTRFMTGLVPYVIATGLAVASAYATLAICAAIAAFYALPSASADT